MHVQVDLGVSVRAKNRFLEVLPAHIGGILPFTHFTGPNDLWVSQDDLDEISLLQAFPKS